MEATTPTPAAPHSAPRERHALTGRSVRLDPRIDAVRADLTDLRLADRVFAPHYAEARTQTALGGGPLFDAPGGVPVSELLPGDAFDLLELSGGMAWGRSLSDGIVGYVAEGLLGEAVAATHIICAREATLGEAPDRNAATLAALPMGSRIAALGERGDFLLTDHGYVAADAVRGLGVPDRAEIAAAALRLIGASERAGGRSGAGVDGAGLIFLAHDVAGFSVPRLHDLIAAALVPAGEAPVAGEVVAFADHLAIMVDAVSAVHVEGKVARERLSTLVERYGAPVAHGRLG